MRSRWLTYALGIVLIVTPVEARADVADVFAASRRIDLTVEIDYRVRFPTPDHLERFEPPDDRVGRERVDEARVRVARAYLRQIADAAVDHARARLPLLAYLERRYDEVTTFRVRGGRPVRPAGGDAVRGGAPGAGPVPDLWAALAHHLPQRGEPDSTELRLRLNGSGLSLALSPTVEIARGGLRCRVGYRPSGDRLEMALAHRLFEDVDLELTASESFGRDGTQFALALRMPF